MQCKISKVPNNTISTTKLSSIKELPAIIQTPSIMKQLKKIEIRPLTDFDTLNLQVASTKHIDLTVLDKAQTTELLAKLHDIVAKTPGAIIASKQGAKTYVNTQIRGSRDKNKIFTFPEPNPICIYYSSANRHLQQSYALKNKFFSEEQHFDANYHYENFIEYFQETSEGVTLLSTTIEGFINQLLPENLQLEIDGVMKNKSEIEWSDITTKASCSEFDRNRFSADKW